MIACEANLEPGQVFYLDPDHAWYQVRDLPPESPLMFSHYDEDGDAWTTDGYCVPARYKIHFEPIDKTSFWETYL